MHKQLFDTLSKNPPSALHDTHSTSAPPRRGRDAAVVYFDSEDDGEALPFKEDVCQDVLVFVVTLIARL
jgi:hypothetical protein